jgi:hypothetical protein
MLAKFLAALRRLITLPIIVRRLLLDTRMLAYPTRTDAVSIRIGRTSINRKQP